MTSEVVYTIFRGHMYAITVETDSDSTDPHTVVGTVVDVEEIGPDHEQHPVRQEKRS